MVKLLLFSYGFALAICVSGWRLKSDREFALNQTIQNGQHFATRRQTTTYSVRPTIAVYNRMLTTEELKAEATW